MTPRQSTKSERKLLKLRENKLQELAKKLDLDIRGYDHIVRYADNHTASLHSDSVDDNIRTIIMKHNYQVNKVASMKIRDFSDLLIKKNSETLSTISIKKNDCDSYRFSSEKYHVISYSAALDIMPKPSIASALKRIKKNNILYFSLCFNGQVRWTPTNTFDKYILTFLYLFCIIFFNVIS